MRINDELVTCYSSSQTCSHKLQTVAQQNSNLFQNRRTFAQIVKPHHTRSNSLRKMFDRAWGRLDRADTETGN